MERKRMLKIIGLLVLFNFLSYLVALIIFEDCVSYTYNLQTHYKSSSDQAHVQSVALKMNSIQGQAPFKITDWWAGYGVLAEVLYIELLIRT